MTWQELYDNLTPEQRQTDVTVYLAWDDEYYPITGIGVTGDYTDVLDPFHPYVVVGEIIDPIKEAVLDALNELP
jgi:hypothetical protein